MTARNGRTALYLIYGEDDVVLYVGVGLSPLTRWTSHSRKPWWGEVRRCDVQWFDTRAEAEAAETVAIKNLRPLHNISQNLYRDEAARILAASTYQELWRQSDLWLTVDQVASAFGLPQDLLWAEVRSYRIPSSTGVPDHRKKLCPGSVRMLLHRLGRTEPIVHLGNSEDLT